jgi:hypothetical protein
MGLYCGIDLHSTNSYLAVMDEHLQTILGRRLPNRQPPLKLKASRRPRGSWGLCILCCSPIGYRSRR